MKKRICFQVVTTIFGMVFCLILFSPIYAQDDNGGNLQITPRDIVPSFETSRPTNSGGDLTNGESVYVQKPSKSRPHYNRVSQRINSGKIRREDKPNRRPTNTVLASNKPKQPVSSRPKVPTANRPNPQKPDLPVESSQQIGVTLWHLLTTNFKGDDSDGQLTLADSANRTRFLTPIRVPLDTLFTDGDYVRLSFEASKSGYLYVVDQEMYADGKLGDAMLVFPNKRINNGANAVKPGKPVELPNLKDNPFYFELRPQGSGDKQIISEVLSVIITDKPIVGLNIGENPILISAVKLADWRRKWAGRAEIFERDTANTTKDGYTKAERDAATSGKSLTANDPLPNTVFLVESNVNGGALITVPLWYGKN